MQILKQSTAVDVLIGPFVDITDGATAETGESPSVKLSKNGQTLAAKNDVTTPVHDADGYYNCELDATDTNTVGNMVLTVAASANALPIRHEFQVVEEAVYDNMFAASAVGPLTAAQVNAECDTAISDAALATAAALATVDTNVDAILVDTGTTLDTKLNDIQGATFSSATDSLEALRDRGDSAWTGSATTSDSGTAQAGAAGTITLQAGASASDDLYNGQIIYISSGTGAGQSRAISDYTGSSKVATVITNWAVTPDNTSVYEIYPDEVTEITAAPTAAAVADAVWDENTAGHTTAGTFGEQCKNDIDAILVDTSTTLDTALATVDANVDAILVDTAEIGAAGAGLTAVPWNAAWDAEVQSEVADGLTAFWTSPATLVDLIWDEDVDTTHQTAGTAGKKLDDAGAAADPWSTALPGAYGAGTAGNIVGNNLDAPVSTVDTVVDGIQTDLDNATDGLGAIKTAVDACATTTELNKVPKSDGTTSWNATALAAINAQADTALTDYDPPTRAELTADINTVITDLDDIKGTGFIKDTHSLVDIEAYVDILDDATSGNAKIATDVAAVLVDTNELQTDDVPGLIAALNNIAASDVLTQVNTALDTAISELGVAAPTATPTVRTALMLLYMALRNKRTTTATTDTISNDAGTTITTSTLSDDTVTFTKGEYS